MIKTIFNDLKDRNVANRMVYGDISSGYLYSDKPKKNKIKAEEVKDLYIKGCVINVDDKLYTPISLEKDGSGFKLGYYNGTAFSEFKSEEII